MGYMHIPNLYKPEAQRILAFKELYALEKIHGTSAHISWQAGAVHFFSGGESHERFKDLFDEAKLASMFLAKCGVADYSVTIYGEAYGGKQQGMRETYGEQLRFIAFDVQIDGKWLTVPQAAGFVGDFGIEFVDWVLIDSTLEAIDAQRDRPSTQAIRNGISEPRMREGIVLRPPFEVTLNNGERLIAKHKRDEFRETRTPRIVTDPAKLAKLEGADAIAQEWVTAERLNHVIDQLIRDREYKRAEMSDIPRIIQLMQNDIFREGADEVTPGKEVARAIGTRTVQLFKLVLGERLRTTTGT